jgi:hypothetical protein
MNSTAKAIVETSSQDLIKRLQDAGQSYSDICQATGMSVSQVSLVGSGKRTLGEKYFRELVRLAIKKKVLILGQ